jgi:hypothetical protein
MRMIIHLIKRYVWALSAKKPSSSDCVEVGRVLGNELFGLWMTMPIHDQAHSIVVWRRYLQLRPSALRAEEVAVLLHDIGKVKSGLGIHARVCATILGPRTKRWRMYSEHEAIGAAMLKSLNVDPITVAIVFGEGHPDIQDALRKADDI